MPQPRRRAGFDPDALARTNDPFQSGTGTRRGFEDWATSRLRAGLPYSTANTTVKDGRVVSNAGRITMADLWPILAAAGGIGIGGLLAGGAGAAAGAAGGAASGGAALGPGLAPLTTLPGTVIPIGGGLGAGAAGAAGAGAAGAAGTAGAGTAGTAATGVASAVSKAKRTVDYGKLAVSGGSLISGLIAGKKSKGSQGATLQTLLPLILSLLQQMQAQNAQRHQSQLQRYQSQQPLHDALSRMAMGLLPSRYTQGLPRPQPLSLPPGGRP